MIAMWSWIADAVLALLLVGTLVMAVRLDGALRVVRRDRAVFETLISNLGSATSSVKLGIQALRNEADRAAEQIERRSEEADKLATDLSFLIEAADRAGSRLEEARQAAAVTSGAILASAVTSVLKQDTNLAFHLPEACLQPTPDTGSLSSSGLRELAGIGKRRRKQPVEVPCEPGLPEQDAKTAVLKAHDPAFQNGASNAFVQMTG